MIKDVTCCLPWNHLATHPNGNVSLCCQAKLDDGSGFAKSDCNFLNLEKHKVIDILNAESFVKTRKKMLNGEIPGTCKRCFDAERNGEWSKRVFENKRFNWKPNNLKETLTDGNLEFLELRLGNVCNLACATCNSISSSKWVKDEIKLSNKLSWYKDITHIEEKRYTWFEDELFYEKLAETNPNLKMIYINGGEPFLIKAHKRLLEKLVQRGKSKYICLEYSTNVTVLPDDYLDLWSQFKSINLMLSIDDVKDRNNWLRWPSQWNTVEENVQWYIKNKLDNTQLIICQTISALNILYIDQLIDYCKNLGLTHTANFVYSPEIFSAKSLSDKTKHTISNRYKNLNLSQLQSWLDLPYDKSLNQKLIEFVKVLDSLRQIDSKIFSHIYE